MSVSTCFCFRLLLISVCLTWLYSSQICDNPYNNELENEWNSCLYANINITHFYAFKLVNSIIIILTRPNDVKSVQYIQWNEFVCTNIDMSLPSTEQQLSDILTTETVLKNPKCGKYRQNRKLFSKSQLKYLRTYYNGLHYWNGNIIQNINRKIDFKNVKRSLLSENIYPQCLTIKPTQS